MSRGKEVRQEQKQEGERCEQVAKVECGHIDHVSALCSTLETYEEPLGLVSGDSEVYGGGDFSTPK